MNILVVDDDDGVIFVLIIVVPQTSTVIFTKFPSNNPSNSQYFRQIQYIYIVINDIDKRSTISKKSG
jgi:hypothetical protein